MDYLLPPFTAFSLLLFYYNSQKHTSMFRFVLLPGAPRCEPPAVVAQFPRIAGESPPTKKVSVAPQMSSEKDQDVIVLVVLIASQWFFHGFLMKSKCNVELDWRPENQQEQHRNQTQHIRATRNLPRKSGKLEQIEKS